MIERFSSILFCIFSLTLFFSCNKKNMDKQSQTLRINSYPMCHSFHPHQSLDAADTTICKALYEGLIRVNMEGKPELALAKEMQVSLCKKRYTFLLKDSTWSNGEKLTSKHFVKAWQAILDCKKRIASQARKFFIIKNAKNIYEGKLSIHDLGVRAPNDETIVIELEHPASYFLQLLAEPAYSPIFDIDEEGLAVFNGPFIIKKFEIGKQLTLKTNPLYWDEKTVRLDEIQFSFIQDENTVFSMYEQGDFDWMGNPFCEIPMQSLKLISNVKHRNTSSPFWIYLNTENDKLKSANIRKALSYAIDRSEIVREIVPYQKELYTIIPTEISSLDVSEYAQNYTLENAKIFFEKGLEELGIKKEDISFTLNHSNYDHHEKIALYLKDVWEKIFGITVILKKDDWKTFCSKLRSNDYDIGGCYVCNLYDHPSYLLEKFEGSYISSWFNESFQKIMQQTRNARKESDQKKYLRQAEEILIEEMPVIPIYNQNNLFICKENLKNALPSKFMYADFKWAYFDD